jgi:hypothetical protein
MELTYDNILKFMHRYYTGFPENALHPDTKQKMYEFYSPRLQVINTLSKPSKFNREEFLQFTSVHPHFTDTPNPEHIIIDEKQKRVAVLVRTDFTLKETGESFIQMMSAHYILELDENNTIKIREILMFPQPAPPGEPDIEVLLAEALEKSKKS